MNGVFPDARLKRGLIELRSTDHQAPEDVMAVPAFWAGLLYDRGAREAALEVLAGTTRAERDAARAVVPRVGLAAPWGGRRLQAVALELVRIARAGLERRAAAGLEAPAAPTLLDRTLARVEAGRSPAHEVLDGWDHAWSRDLRAFVEANRYRP
jgi:glutamate--cysteine ligase